MKEIEPYLELIKNPDLKEATQKYLDYHWARFSKVPASIKFHHVNTGGLLDHVLEVLNIGIDLIKSLNLENRVNLDHYIISALIHDIAKVDRYQWNKLEQKWEYSKQAKGNDPHVVTVGRADHSIYPIIDFPIVTRTPLPKEVALAVLGHMGGFSVTSVKPDTLLEVILSASDYISSRLVRA